MISRAQTNDESPRIRQYVLVFSSRFSIGPHGLFFLSKTREVFPETIGKNISDSDISEIKGGYYSGRIDESLDCLILDAISILVPIILTLIILLFLAPIVASFLPIGYAVAQPTFGKSINVSVDSASAQDPNVQSVGNHVYVVWTERSGGIKFRSSVDGGVTWNPPLTKPALRISSVGGTAQYPLMSANGSNVYVVWAQSIGGTGLQIMEATSLNSGTSFGTPVQLTTGSPVGGLRGTSHSVVGEQRLCCIQRILQAFLRYLQRQEGTRLALGLFLLHMVLIVNLKLRWGGMNVYAHLLPRQHCREFQQLRTFHEFALRPKISEPWIWGYGPNVYAAWEGKGSGSQITYTKTNDHGATWSTPANFSLVDVWAPQIGAFGNSAWIAMQQHPGNSASQIYLFASTNGGTSWSAPISLSGAPAPGRDTSFAFTIATSDGKNVFVAWSQQLAPGHWVLRVSYSADGGSSWTRCAGDQRFQKSERRSRK